MICRNFSYQRCHDMTYWRCQLHYSANCTCFYNTQIYKEILTNLMKKGTNEKKEKVRTTNPNSLKDSHMNKYCPFHNSQTLKTPKINFYLFR